jgi:hypothetical protein
VFPAARLPVIALEVTAADTNILRPARVVEPHLDGDHLVPFELGRSTLRRASRDEATAADLVVPIRVPTGTQVDLTIDDGSNLPLNLGGVVALIAPLPWIYFESADSQPLTARLGDAKLAGPAYDLEAVRPRLPTTPAATANWGDAITLPIPPEDRAPPPSLIGARIDVGGFRYARAVPVGPSGLTALSLDAAALAHSRLADVRIVDGSGRQLPYLLESRDEPLALPLGKPVSAQPPAWLARRDVALGSHPGEVAKSQNRSWYTLRLPHEGLPASRLLLTTSARVFTRQLTVFMQREPVSPRERTGAQRLVSEMWSHANPDERAPQMTLELPGLPTRDLVLVVDEGDNAPIDIDSATLLLPGYRVRFFATEGAPLTLYYGDDSVGAPRYDLALLRPHLLGVPATEIAPGPERLHATPVPPAQMPTWAFWGVLVAAVMVLLGLIARLLRSEGAAAS